MFYFAAVQLVKNYVEELLRYDTMKWELSVAKLNYGYYIFQGGSVGVATFVFD